MQTKMKLNGRNWGGLREGAGRRRRKSPGVSHSLRERVSPRTPLHVNFKFRIHLRNKETLKLLKHAIRNARRHGLRVRDYSFQSNHIHLIIEASDNAILTKGMRSLTITFAKGVNRGRIQIERYHLHVLKTLREIKHATHYVLFNEQKHESGTCSAINEYSSLLCHKEALILIRKLLQKERMALTIGRNDWEPDGGESYLLKRAWSEFTRPG